MLPVVLIDAFFTYVHINSSINQAEILLQSKGVIVAKQISDASEFYLFSGNYEQISHLLNQAIDTDDVIYAAVYNSNNEIIAHASTPNFKFHETNQYFYYRDTVYSQNISQQDIFEPDVEIHEDKSLGWVNLYLSKISLRENQRLIFIEGTVFFVSMILLAVILTLLISRRITIPIQRLNEHLNRVEKGQLGELISAIESNEIGEMQKGFNSMTQSLLKSRLQLNEKIEVATKDLTKAVSTLEHKNSELSIARDNAQKADRTKSQFLANISHEIRTPINGIKGFANLLMNTGLNTDQTRYANIISQSTMDLSNIINEVLDFSKMEYGKLELFESPFNLIELVENTRDSLFAVNLGNTDVDLNLNIYSDTPQSVIGDKNHLRQILINLIGNAIKFTNKGYVSITVYLEDEIDGNTLISFKIEDSGIGISEDDQKLLFKAFSQIESDSNRRYTGSGLGLVISKNLALLMGGNITLESQQGEGSTFTLTLPFKPFHVELAEACDTDTLESSQPTVIIYSCKKRCLSELQSLYNRACFNTEAILIPKIDRSDAIEGFKNQLKSSLSYIDFIIFDLRNCQYHPSRIISSEVSHNIPVIIMHYDKSYIDSSLYPDYQFISVINTTKQLANQIHQPNTDSIITDVSVISPYPKKILIVDDNQINLTLATELTKMWGHEPFEAINSVQALTLFNDQDFDMILLDIQMPDVDGIEVMRLMRAQKPELTTPIVALTATHINDDESKLLFEGFDAFLSKPLDENKLKALLNTEEVSIPPQPLKADIENTEISIDYARTLQLSGNNTDLLRDIFYLLKSEIPSYIMQLDTAVNDRLLDDINSIIHRLHGITCYTALPKLRQLVVSYQHIKYAEPEKVFILCKKIIDTLKELEKSLTPYLTD